MIVDPVIEQKVIDRMGQMYHDYAKTLAELNDIRLGKTVVIPADIEHARFMVQMGQHYIDSCHQETMKALTRVY